MWRADGYKIDVWCVSTNNFKYELLDMRKLKMYTQIFNECFKKYKIPIED